jgi:hypothetical protein
VPSGSFFVWFLLRGLLTLCRGSWDALGDMGKGEAQQKYIDTLLELAKDFPASEQKEKLLASLWAAIFGELLHLRY